jgi:hypothetical protein
MCTTERTERGSRNVRSKEKDQDERNDPHGDATGRQGPIFYMTEPQTRPKHHTTAHVITRQCWAGARGTHNHTHKHAAMFSARVRF